MTFVEAIQKNYPDFVMDAEQEQYYVDLAAYFQGEKKKGLLVSGEVGCGKTFSFHAMQKLFGGFEIISTRHIVREYLKDGVEVLDRYGRNHSPSSKPIALCLDDLGLEEVNANMYGNHANVIGEILLDRYEIFIKRGMITYATTNLLSNDLERIYGTRLRDRLKEMMRVLPMPGKTKRK